MRPIDAPHSMPFSWAFPYRPMVRDAMTAVNARAGWREWQLHPLTALLCMVCSQPVTAKCKSLAYVASWNNRQAARGPATRHASFLIPRPGPFFRPSPAWARQRPHPKAHQHCACRGLACRPKDGTLTSFRGRHDKRDYLATDSLVLASREHGLGVPMPWQFLHRTFCQRSFNWQSTAFVMRGLWVRLPPLAL